MKKIRVDNEIMNLTSTTINDTTTTTNIDTTIIDTSIDTMMIINESVFEDSYEMDSIRLRLEAIDQLRELVIKESRDVQKLSKQGTDIYYSSKLFIIDI